MTAGYSYFQNGNEYEFFTKFGASYLIAVDRADVYFNTANPVSDFIFSIDIQQIDPGPFNSFDFMVGITVAEIVLHFINGDSRNIIFYICDPVDGRMQARERKFNGWFLFFNDNNYRKLSETINSKNLCIQASFIYHKNNPFAYDLPLSIEDAKDNFGNK